jgi:hypothetical protein
VRTHALRRVLGVLAAPAATTVLAALARVAGALQRAPATMESSRHLVPEGLH